MHSWKLGTALTPNNKQPNQTQQTNLTLPRLKLCSEFLADQDAALFWDYIDALTAANGVADSTTSAADAQRAAMKAAETSIGGTVQGVRQRLQHQCALSHTSPLVCPVQLLNVSLALGAYSPAVELHRQVQSSCTLTVSPLRLHAVLKGITPPNTFAAVTGDARCMPQSLRLGGGVEPAV